jgi:hypothetical protein
MKHLPPDRTDNRHNRADGFSAYVLVGQYR